MRWDRAVDQFATVLKLAGESSHAIAGQLSALTLATAYGTTERARQTVVDDLGR